MIIVKKKPAPDRKRVIAGSFVIGIITFVAVLYPLVIQPMLMERKAEGELLQMPAFAQIAKWEPNLYKQIKTEVFDAVRRHEPSAQVQGRVRLLVQKLSRQYIGTASDEAAVEYLRVNVEEVRRIADRDPDVAFAMVYDGKSDADVSKYIDDALLKRDQAALAELIHTGVAKEASYQNDDRARRLVNEIIAGMRTDFGEDADLPFNRGRKVYNPNVIFKNEQHRDAAAEAVILQGVADRSIDKPKANRMMLEFYDRVLALRTDQAALVTRLLLQSRPS
jgi:hypothetical protein